MVIIGDSFVEEAIVLRRYGLPARPKRAIWMLFEGNDLTVDFQRYEETLGRSQPRRQGHLAAKLDAEHGARRVTRGDRAINS
jgi:hypothetical protein